MYTKYMYKQLLNQKGEPCMKKLLATILTIALVLSLSACGGPSNTSSPAASGTETADQTAKPAGGEAGSGTAMAEKEQESWKAAQALTAK